MELDRTTGHVTVWALEQVPADAAEDFIPRESTTRRLGSAA